MGLRVWSLEFGVFLVGGLGPFRWLRASGLPSGLGSGGPHLDLRGFNHILDLGGS